MNTASQPPSPVRHTQKPKKGRCVGTWDPAVGRPPSEVQCCRRMCDMLSPSYLIAQLHPFSHLPPPGLAAALSSGKGRFYSQGPKGNNIQKHLEKIDPILTLMEGWAGRTGATMPGSQERDAIVSSLSGLGWVIQQEDLEKYWGLHPLPPTRPPPYLQPHGGL